MGHWLSQLGAVWVRSVFENPGSDRIDITFRVRIGIRIQGVADVDQYLCPYFNLN
jgi:hypothetical protein